MNRRLGQNIVFFKISLKREYTQLALRVFSLQFNFSKYNVPPASTDSLHNIIRFGRFIYIYNKMTLPARLFQNACG